MRDDQEMKGSDDASRCAVCGEAIPPGAGTCRCGAPAEGPEVVGYLDAILSVMNVPREEGAGQGEHPPPTPPPAPAEPPTGGDGPAAVPPARADEPSDAPAPGPAREEAPPPPPTSAPAVRKPRWGLLLGSAVVALTVAGLLLGQRSRQERPARLHRELVSSLRGAGAPEVAVTVTPELTVILQGTVRSEEERRRLDRLVEGEGARKVVNAVQVFRREAMVEKVLNDRLKSAGLDGVHADVDESMTARLTGRVTRSEEVERALQLTRSDPEVSRVVNEVTLEPLTKPAGPGPPSPPPFDPVRFEGIINRQLRQAGFNGLSVAVGEDLAVAVKGSVESRDAKQRALDLVGAQAGGRKVKDLIFVVEP